MNEAARELRARWQALPGRAVQADLALERGTMQDYEKLAVHHYKGSRPATATRVLVFRCGEGGRFQRYRGRGSGAQVAGVLVESMPCLSCRMREEALGGRYSGWGDAWQRARVLNQEMRCISRVVVHPQWRGMGLAGRLVGAALGTAETIYTEAMAAMGRVHPFFDKAGMRAYPRPAHEYDARLLEVLRTLELPATLLGMREALLARVEKLGGRERAWFGEELRRWYLHRYGRSGKRSAEVREQLGAAQRHLLAWPVYYLMDHRGKGGRGHGDSMD